MAGLPSTRLLDLLPALYREDPSGADDPFIAHFLLAFEKLLLGFDDGNAAAAAALGADGPGIEQRIDRLAETFDALRTPREFLPWLASWVALSLRADIDEPTQRRFLANIVQRYRRRGTLSNLQELLTMFTRGTPSVVEDATPHQFTVNFVLATQKAFTSSGATTPYIDYVNRQIDIALALIDLEKPAHTAYRFIPTPSSFQVGVTSHLGVETLLGVAN